MKQFISHFILQSRMVVLSFAVLAAFTACSDSGEATSKSTGPATIFGGMFGEDGPIMEAKLTAKDATGAIVATAQIKGSSDYELDLPANTVYPVVITAVYPRSTKLAESGHGKLRAVAMEGGHLRIDLSPTTTRIVKSALRMGGLTPENVQSAARTAMRLGIGQGGSGGGHVGH